MSRRMLDSPVIGDSGSIKMQRLRLASVVVMGVVFMTLSSIAAAQNQVKVFVTAGADGFAAKDADDSVLDLTKALQKKRLLTVVYDEAAADIVVRVEARSSALEVTGVTTYTTTDRNGKKTTHALPQRTNMKTLNAELEVGRFKMPLKGEAAFWTVAADHVASTVDKWALENIGRIMQARSEKPADSMASTSGRPTAPSAAPAPATPAPAPKDTALHQGMTTAEVKALAGEPVKKVSFGTRTMWNYGGFEVIFENDKVIDVKFGGTP
jgi:hypothetical protein